MEQPPKCKHRTMCFTYEDSNLFLWNLTCHLGTPWVRIHQQLNCTELCARSRWFCRKRIRMTEKRSFEKVFLGKTWDCSGKHQRFCIKTFHLILCKCEFSVIPFLLFDSVISVRGRKRIKYLRSCSSSSAFAFCNLFRLTILHKSQMSMYLHIKASIPMMQRTHLSRFVKNSQVNHYFN